MATDQDVDTAGTEADDESVTAKTHGFGDHAPGAPQPDQPAPTTIPDEQAADDDPASRGTGMRKTGDKGGVS